VIDIKNGKCSKGHLIFKCEGEFIKGCHICAGEINGIGFVCNICDISICVKCWDQYGNYYPMKCNICKYELLWRRCFYDKCKKCAKNAECYWKCFFCNLSFCVNCINPTKGYCGDLHKLEYLDLNNIKKINEYNLLHQNSYSGSSQNNLRFKNFINDSISQMKGNCSHCSYFCNSEMSYCKRCLYQKCPTCDDVKLEVQV
jgi:hypothetical protein